MIIIITKTTTTTTTTTTIIIIIIIVIIIRIGSSPRWKRSSEAYFHHCLSPRVTRNLKIDGKNYHTSNSLVEVQSTEIELLVNLFVLNYTGSIRFTKCWQLWSNRINREPVWFFRFITFFLFLLVISLSKSAIITSYWLITEFLNPICCQIS